MKIYNGFATVFLVISVATMGNCIAAERDDTPQSDFYIDDVHTFVFKDKIEVAVPVPPIPDDSAFVQMAVDHAPSGLDVYIDLAGIFVDQGNSSLHFWILLKNNQGAYNLSYEGYRCSAHSFKVHGWGSRGQEPEFRENSNAQWQKTAISAGSRYRRELDDYYFCQDGKPFSPKELLERYKYKTITYDEADM